MKLTDSLQMECNIDKLIETWHSTPKKTNRAIE